MIQFIMNKVAFGSEICTLLYILQIKKKNLIVPIYIENDSI